MADLTLDISITAPTERWQELETALDLVYADEPAYPDAPQAKAKYAIVQYLKEVIYRYRRRISGVDVPEDIS